MARAPSPPAEFPELKDWESLNSVVICATEEYCGRLMKAELEGRRRLTFVLRIHARINRLRATRERDEYAALCRKVAA